MSLDTVTRVNAFFESVVATPNNIFTIYEELNERQSDGNGRGPIVRLFIEVGNETLSVDGIEWFEEGIVIAQVFVDVGESTADQHRIATIIKNAFRQVRLTASASNEGDIYFQDVEMGRGGQVPKEQLRNSSNQKQRYWVKQDVFITYNKYSCTFPPLWLDDGTGGINNPWNDQDIWSE